MFTLQNSFTPLLIKGGGVKSISRGDCTYIIARRKTYKTFVPNSSKNSASVPFSTGVAYKTRTRRFVSKTGYNSRQETEALMKEHGGTGPWFYCFSMLYCRVRTILGTEGVWGGG